MSTDSINEKMNISSEDGDDSSDDSCSSTSRSCGSVEEIKEYYAINYPENNVNFSLNNKRKLKLQDNKTLRDLESSHHSLSVQKKTLFDCSTGSLKPITGQLFNELDNIGSLPSLNYNQHDSIIEIKDPADKKFLEECQLFTSLVTIKRIVNKHCCNKNCLQNNLSDNNGMDLAPCYNFVSAVRGDLVGKDMNERKMLLTRMINGSRDGKTASGRPKMKYQLYSDKFNDATKYSFCAKSFCSIVGMSKGLRQRICSSTNAFQPSDIANNYDQLKIPGGKQTSVSSDTFKHIKTILEINKVVLTNNSLSYFVVPDGDKSLKAHAWLEQFFNLVGDKQPNKFDEIHLDSITRKSVWEEYAQNMKLFYGDEVNEVLSYSRLLSLWDSTFPNVKIRQYKNVSGHCKTCERLTNLRATTKDNYKRGLLTQLHAYHRHLYMGERESYYHRQMEALCRPNDFMSLITDGMNQQHSQVPYLANQNDFGQKETLVQHLQLTIEHGQRIDVYRTLGNIKSDRNPAIHALLLQLERRIAEFGFLPPTIYIQVDGGAENANETLLGILALIVARRLGKVRRILLTRLPVGHTHEDGDGLFGNLWKKTRTQSAESPSEYKKLIEETFAKGGLPATVTDIIATPDYTELLKGCVDPALSHLWKVEHTKLQWIFEAVNDDNIDHSLSIKYPFGVKCTYRAFVQKQNFEIIPVDSNITPSFDLEYRVRHSFHETFPSPDEPPINILIEPPNGTIIPKGFVLNSHSHLMKTLRKVRSYFANKPHVVADWELFANSMPTDDFVENYINRDSVVWHVPLKDDLFGELCIINTRANIEPVVKVARSTSNVGKKVKKDFENCTFDPEMFNGLPIQKAKSTSSVIHSGNMNFPIPLPRVLIADDAIPSNPAEIQTQFYKWIDRMVPDASVTTKRLQQLLKKADTKLKTSGPKRDLLTRLQDFYKAEQEESKKKEDAKIETIEKSSSIVASLTKPSLNKTNDMIVDTQPIVTFTDKLQLLEHFESIAKLLSNDNKCVKKQTIVDSLESNRNLIVVSKSKQNKMGRDKLLNHVLQMLR